MTAQMAEALLPRVSGRHRDRALASARKCRAIQLKLQGLTYQQIADELGYTSRGTVYKIIKTAQATQLTGAVEEHLDIEVSRLNALQAPSSVPGHLLGHGLVVVRRGDVPVNPHRYQQLLVPRRTTHSSRQRRGLCGLGHAVCTSPQGLHRTAADGTDKARLTQAELAERDGLSVTMVQNLERLPNARNPRLRPPRRRR